MTDTPPDRLSVDPRSPHYNEAVLQRGIGIRFRGVERTNVVEYCVSEGWVETHVGKTVDRHGQPMKFRHRGAVEAYFQDQAAGEAAKT